MDCRFRKEDLELKCNAEGVLKTLAETARKLESLTAKEGNTVKAFKQAVVKEIVEASWDRTDGEYAVEI